MASPVRTSAPAARVAAAAHPSTVTPARRYARDVLWAARMVAGVAILIATHTWPTFLHHLSLIMILSVLTYPVRSVRWGTVYNFFLGGYLFAWALGGAQYVIERVLLSGHFPVLGSIVVAPVTEEIGKVLPLLILALAWRGFRNSYGACDLMLCGAALGSGFGLLEDSLRRVQSYPAPASPALFGIAIFPDSYRGFLGHGASAAFIALALGYLTYALHWRRWRLPGVVALLLVTFWMMVDHALANLSVFSYSQSWLAPVRWMWRLDQNGRLSPYVLLALILSTIALERMLLWRSLRKFRRLQASTWIAYFRAPLKNGSGYAELRAIVMRLWAFFQYVLSYRRLGFLMAHWKGDIAPNRQAFAPPIVRYATKILAMHVTVRQT